MKLITKEIEKKFEQTSEQINEKDPIVVVKFFNPKGAGTWYATEITEYHLVKKNTNGTENLETVSSYEEKEESLKKGYKLDDIIFFGYVSIFEDHNDEWGLFSLRELKKHKEEFGLKIERDINCPQQAISKFNIKSLKL